MDLQQRFQLLKEAGQIDETTHNYLLDAVAIVGKETDSQPTEENAAQLFTHLAMAISRQQKGEIAGDMDSTIYEALQAESSYREAQDVWTKLHETSPIPFAQSEVQFMILHLTTYISGTK